MEDSLIKEYITKSKELNKLNDELTSKYSGVSKEKIANGIICELCNTTAFTFSEHDYRTCDCGKNGIDGGLTSMFRMIGKTHQWIPTFVIKNKKIRRENPELKIKTQEMVNIIEKLKRGM